MISRAIGGAGVAAVEGYLLCSRLCGACLIVLPLALMASSIAYWSVVDRLFPSASQLFPIHFTYGTDDTQLDLYRPEGSTMSVTEAHVPFSHRNWDFEPPAHTEVVLGVERPVYYLPRVEINSGPYVEVDLSVQFLLPRRLLNSFDLPLTISMEIISRDGRRVARSTRSLLPAKPSLFRQLFDYFVQRSLVALGLWNDVRTFTVLLIDRFPYSSPDWLGRAIIRLAPAIPVDRAFLEMRRRMWFYPIRAYLGAHRWTAYVLFVTVASIMATAWACCLVSLLWVERILRKSTSREGFMNMEQPPVAGPLPNVRIPRPPPVAPLEPPPMRRSAPPSPVRPMPRTAPPSPPLQPLRVERGEAMAAQQRSQTRQEVPVSSMPPPADIGRGSTEVFFDAEPLGALSTPRSVMDEPIQTVTEDPERASPSHSRSRVPKERAGRRPSLPTPFAGGDEASAAADGGDMYFDVVENGDWDILDTPREPSAAAVADSVSRTRPSITTLPIPEATTDVDEDHHEASAQDRGSSRIMQVLRGARLFRGQDTPSNTSPTSGSWLRAGISSYGLSPRRPLPADVPESMMPAAAAAASAGERNGEAWVVEPLDSGEVVGGRPARRGGGQAGRTGDLGEGGGDDCGDDELEPVGGGSDSAERDGSDRKKDQ